MSGVIAHIRFARPVRLRALSADASDRANRKADSQILNEESMPHMSIEYSPGVEESVDMAGFCAAIHGAMREVEIFPLAGIRVRAHKADYAIVADGLPENGFVALALSVGAGRSTQVLQEAGNRIFAVARAALADQLSTTHFALSLQIRVIDSDLSWKATPIHNRLSKHEQSASG